MKCISCENDYIKFSDKSYIGLPIFYCKNCGIYVTGDNEEKIIEKTLKTYKEKHWGEGKLWNAEQNIKSNYHDLDSQGKKRSWISQKKYCKPFMKNKTSILEIGTGQGQAIWWFEEDGYTVTGIEPDEKNVDMINKKLNKGRCILGTAEDFEINESFDIIWMSHVLEHLIKPKLFLNKIKKNLKKDGFFFIEVPNCENKEMLEISINLVPHTFHFSKNSLINLAKKTGYNVEKCDYLKPATKKDGAINKIFKNVHPYYPRILAKKNTGRDLRIILTKK